METLENTQPQVTPFIKSADNEILINTYCLHIYPSDTISEDERKMYEQELRRRGVNITQELHQRATPEALKKVYENLQIDGLGSLCEDVKNRMNANLH